MEFGVLLPNASRRTSRERLVDFASRIEALGFDSVWVRDNLGFQGHDWEPAGERPPQDSAAATVLRTAAGAQLVVRFLRATTAA